jgi:hypothetical protein
MFVECEYCEPDHLGPGDRWGEWNRKRHDPTIARWFAPDDLIGTRTETGADS